MKRTRSCLRGWMIVKVVRYTSVVYVPFELTSFDCDLFGESICRSIRASNDAVSVENCGFFDFCTRNSSQAVLHFLSVSPHESPYGDQHVVVPVVKTN